MILKNTTFKNTYIGKLKKIPLVKNIVKGTFLFLLVFLQLLVAVYDNKIQKYGFQGIKVLKYNWFKNLKYGI